ncbi:hypothetical protein ACA30_01650 [Virgibacillus soli]|nr:hypothetical protein ACA30_01650 [Virgibacillus soli]
MFSQPLNVNNLPNGLRVYTSENYKKYNYKESVACFLLAYNIGSNYDPPGLSGLSHFLEHMMFKGTTQFPKGTMEKLIWECGGQFNAITSLDFTFYYTLLPSNNIELAMKIEGDRMQHMHFDHDLILREKKIITAEYALAMNHPKLLLYKSLYSTAFQKSPYRNLAIGSPNEIENITSKDLITHYDKYYRPENASIFVIGDIHTDNVLSKAHSCFGSIPSNDTVQSHTENEPEQKKERRIIIEHDVDKPYLSIAWKMPEAGHPDKIIFDILVILLSGAPPLLLGGRKIGFSSSILFNLIEKRYFLEINSAILDTKQPGLFIISGILQPGRNPAEVETILLECLENLKSKPIPNEKLNSAVKFVKAQFAYSQEDVVSQTLAISKSIIKTNDSTYWIRYLEQLENITSNDIMRVANTYLVKEKRTIAKLLPTMKSSGIATSMANDSNDEIGSTPYFQKPNSFYPVYKSHLIDRHLTLLDSSKIVSKLLPNGMKLVFYRLDKSPSVSIRMSMNAGANHDPFGKEGLSYLTTKLLHTSCLSDYSSVKWLDQNGILLNIDSNFDTVIGKLNCLKDDFLDSFKFFIKALRYPSFNHEDFLEMKRSILTQMEKQSNNPEALMLDKLYNFLYPNNHIYRRQPEGSVSSLMNLEYSDIVNFHRDFFKPEGAIIVIVGDINEGIIDNLTTSYFNDWFGGNEQPSLPRVKTELRFTDHVEFNSELTDISFNWLTVGKNHPDYLGLDILAVLLGKKDSLYGGRLYKNLREKQGLSYSQHVNYPTAGFQVPWTINISVNPSSVKKGIKSVQEEVSKLKEDLIPSEELDTVKSYLMGRRLIMLNSESIATTLEECVRYGLGFNYINKYPDLLYTISPQILRNIACRYLNDQYSIITIGPKLNSE